MFRKPFSLLLTALPPALVAFCSLALTSVGRGQTLADVVEVATLGSRVSFTAVADGYPAPTFQWFLEGIPIPGATGNTFVLPAVAATHAGAYHAVATNSEGWALSNEILLRVESNSGAPVFTVQPPAVVSHSVGANVNLTVAASGSPVPTYQWYRGGLKISGANQPTLAFPSLALTDAGVYMARATNTAGSVWSDPITLAVLATKPTDSGDGIFTPSTPEAVAPLIQVQPESLMLSAGTDGALSVTVSGSPLPTYQWYRDGVALAGATSSTYSWSGVTLDQQGSYWLVATNSAGSVTSSAATLTVLQLEPALPPSLPVSNIPAPPAPVIEVDQAPQFTLEPDAVVNVNSGSTLVLSVAVSGSPAPSLQWMKNGRIMWGFTEPTLTMPWASSNDTAVYWVVATNRAGVTQSTPISVTIGASAAPSAPADGIRPSAGILLSR